MCSQNDDTSQHDDTLRAALDDVLRVFDAPFSTSPEQRRRIRERAERALAASATDGTPCEDHRKQGFIYTVLGCPRCYPAPAASATEEGPCSGCHQPKEHAYHTKHGRTWEPPWHPYYAPRLAASATDEATQDTAQLDWRDSR